MLICRAKTPRITDANHNRQPTACRRMELRENVKKSERPIWALYEEL